MGDWLHCNTCFCQPGNGATTLTNFHMTNCGHIFCEKCLSTLCSEKKCKMCGIAQIKTTVLSAKMPGDMENFFEEPTSLLKKYKKKLQMVSSFQAAHRKRFTSHINGKLKKQTAMLEKANEMDEYEKKLESEDAKLTEENAYLNTLLNDEDCSPGQVRASPDGTRYSSPIQHEEQTDSIPVQDEQSPSRYSSLVQHDEQSDSLASQNEHFLSVDNTLQTESKCMTPSPRMSPEGGSISVQEGACSNVNKDS